MNLDRLKGKLREKGKSYEDCAGYLGVSVTTFNSKMNGRSKFYVDEINKLSTFLGLSNSEKIDIFLNQNLHTMQEKREGASK